MTEEENLTVLVERLAAMTGNIEDRLGSIESLQDRMIAEIAFIKKLMAKSGVFPARASFHPWELREMFPTEKHDVLRGHFEHIVKLWNGEISPDSTPPA